MNNKRIWIRFDSFINSIKRIKWIKPNIRLINELNPNPQNFNPIRLFVLPPLIEHHHLRQMTSQYYIIREIYRNNPLAFSILNFS